MAARLRASSVPASASALPGVLRLASSLIGRLLLAARLSYVVLADKGRYARAWTRICLGGCRCRRGGLGPSSLPVPLMKLQRLLTFWAKKFDKPASTSY